MNELSIIGVPTSAGAHHAGQDLAPAALRAAGLPGRLARAGLAVTDAGDLPGAVFTADRENPAARNVAAVARVAGEVADAVAAAVAAGKVPFVLGGDCTITIGAVAGLRRIHPDGGLIYLDGDTDLGFPGDGGSGILDSMGISHMLGRGARELTHIAGAAPLLEPAKLAMIGGDPRETTDAGRDYLVQSGVDLQEAPVVISDPAGAAKRAVTAVTSASGKYLVHFDIDVVDSGDLPLGNFPHYGSGVSLDAALTALRVR
ncbi:MAG: arginase family protein, partial [Nocardiopsaceae bacterium]|nr:arginase family protein [Nocardiopsaceae bacterium]